MAFAQICDINNLLEGKPGPTTDAIAQIFDKNYPVGKTGENFLTYFIDYAHKNNVKVDISFGGSFATGPDVTLPGSPETEAQNLVKFMSNYALDSIDFDLEGTSATKILEVNTPKDACTFFSSLHTSLKAESKPSIITLEGSLENAPTGTLKPLFTNFNELFDGVNLMLYSTSQYYIDADNVTWCIKQWIEFVPPSGIHIGFYDKINYTNPASSAGEAYDIPAGLTNGEAAGFIYKTLKKNLNTINPDYANLGQPFIWTDDPSVIPTNTFMSDSYNYLNS